MKHNSLIFLLAVLMSIVCSTASAHDIKVDGINYSITSTKYPFTVTYQGISLWDYCFDFEHTRSVTIPRTITYNGKIYRVTSIGEQAFKNCYRLTSITYYATTPPSVESDTFSNITSATLHVPAESVDTYKNTSPWSRFGSIVAIE